MPKPRLPDVLPTRRDAPAFVALLVVYFVLAVGGLQWTVVPGAGTALWPAAGVAFAALILGGVRLWPAIVLGRLLAAVAVGSPLPWWAHLAIAVATAAGAVVPLLIIRKSGPFDPRLGSLNEMARLVLVAAVLGALVSGLPAVAALSAAGLPPERAVQVLEAWCFGFAVGVLLFAPAVLAWAPREARRMPLSQWLHLLTCLLAVTVVAGVVFLSAPFQPVRTWHLFPVLVWAALAFSVRGAALALLITSGLAIYSSLSGNGPLSELGVDARTRLMIAQQFAAASGVTILILAAVADERRSKDRLARSEAQLRAETEALETINRTGEGIAAELNLDRLVQRVTDAGVALTGAEFGAFFYNVLNEQGESFLLYSLSGAPREAFEAFGMPRNTKIFDPTFSGQGIVRSDDITKDPRYGKNAPHKGMPKGHLPVHSYLAAPVTSRSGQVIGGLFFGHSDTGVFTERAERLITGIAAQAAVAIDNARLYQAAQREIEERRRAEEHQRLLIHELNHRVKNTLATVQSIAAQSARSAGRAAGPDPFLDRLIALSRAHDVLTRESWEGAELSAIVRGAVQAFETGARFDIEGPDVWLEPQAALALAMALHELGTNASKYGALSQEGGRVSIGWSLEAAEKRLGGGTKLQLCWREAGGPPVVKPTRRGFGSRLLEKGLAAELGGTVEVDYRPDGLVCTVEAVLPESEPREDWAG